MEAAEEEVEDEEEEEEEIEVGGAMTGEKNGSEECNSSP